MSGAGAAIATGTTAGVLTEVIKKIAEAIAQANGWTFLSSMQVAEATFALAFQTRESKVVILSLGADGRTFAHLAEQSDVAPRESHGYRTA